MQESLFDKYLLELQEQQKKITKTAPITSTKFKLTPVQASIVEKGLQNKWNEEAYILLPYRQSTQVCYKQGYKEVAIKSYAQEEIENIKMYNLTMQFVSKKMNKELFQCFLTLQILKNNPLSKYFLHLPDPLFLRLAGFTEMISQPIDMFGIAHKILRNQYKNSEEFEIDMTTMIHNYRIFFQNDEEMFDISIKFEVLYEKVYIQQTKNYKDSLEIFKKYRKKLNDYRVRKQPQQRFSKFQKKQLVGQLLNLKYKNHKEFETFLKKHFSHAISKDNEKFALEIGLLNNSHFSLISNFIRQQELIQEEKQQQRKHEERQKIMKNPEILKQYLSNLSVEQLVGDDDSPFF